MKHPFAIIITALLLTCDAPEQRHAKHQFFRMSTMVDVTVSTHVPEAGLQPLWNAVDSMLADWEKRFSQSNPLSEVRGLNSRKGNVCPVTKELGSMVADALAWGDTTRGLFDATIFPVKNLWGLGETDTIHRIPMPDTLAAVLKHVNYRNVQVSAARDTVVFSDSSVQIDAGGFAKGYALLRTASLLDARGFTDYLVTAGDVLGRGRRKDGKPWRIGIMHPRNGGLIATVPFDGRAIFTSGDYENFRMEGDRRIHHIFNPKSGLSCTGNQSVTIESPSAVQAKYLSTGLFCLEADSIVSFVERRGLNCFVVDSTGKVYISSGWKSRIALQ